MNRRRFRIASVLSLAGLLGLAWASSAEEEIKKLESDRSAAVINGDVATMDKQTSDDYTLINAFGQLMDKKQAMDGIKSGQIKITSNDLSDLKVRIYGNTAVITGRSDVKGTMSGKEINGAVMFTRVYVKKDGRWQSVAFQQTPISKQ